MGAEESMKILRLPHSAITSERVKAFAQIADIDVDTALGRLVRLWALGHSTDDPKALHQLGFVDDKGFVIPPDEDPSFEGISELAKRRERQRRYQEKKRHKKPTKKVDHLMVELQGFADLDQVAVTALFTEIAHYRRQNHWKAWPPVTIRKNLKLIQIHGLDKYKTAFERTVANNWQGIFLDGKNGHPRTDRATGVIQEPGIEVPTHRF